LVYDTGGIQGRIPARATVHSLSEADRTPELSNREGQGVGEELWTRLKDLDI